MDGRSKAVMEYLNVRWEWESEAEREADSKFVSATPCINDACERACHLASVTNEQGPRTENSRQDFYLVVNDAKKIPHTSLSALNAYYEEH